MSKQLINEYRADLDRLRAVSGSRRESVLREAFKDLLKRWGRTNDLQFIPEHAITTPQKNRIYLDGALLHALRVPFGYWEAKDADDDLDAEIAAKSRKGYPRDNIVYSDDHTAILIQDGYEVARVAMDDTDALYPLLTRFFAHERQEIADFNKAVKQFSQDLPAVLEALRDLIAKKRKASKPFVSAEKAFLKHAQEAINPAVTEGDVQEMLIQHILTEDIFAKVFDNPDFHRQNNVASELYKLESKLFARGEKSTLLRALSPYYAGIAHTAAVIQSHSEKQGFLKGLYENFYKVYNAKAADRLGVVYTPGEIVRFMIRSTDWLCEKHFGKNLVDRGVEILDPATGTGTFIVELLEHFRGHHDKLRHKYREELHANEVAILPYYVANLNIEATYQAITGQFAEFENLCFVDTLDNVDALGIHSGHQFELLGSLTDENIERIKKQNRRKISVIIGNPPYNANQQNENDNNKNRTYAHIDKRIKNTYIKASTAQKTKLYDMYARFFRWASDRLGDEGVIAFVTNRSFIDARTFDGFRETMATEFSQVYVVDLGGDYRRKEDEGGGGNVFGIGTGVSVSFWIKTKTQPKSPAQLRYHLCSAHSAEDKLSWLSASNIADIQFKTGPGTRDLWFGANEVTFDRDTLLLADADRKTSQSQSGDRAIFRLYSLGVVSARDDWVWDRERGSLASKVRFHLRIYNKWRQALKTDSTIELAKDVYAKGEIKWSRLQRTALERGEQISFDEGSIRMGFYRPFNRQWFYYSNRLNEVLYQTGRMFTPLERNPSLTIMGDSTGKPYFTFAIDLVPDYNFVSSGSGGTQTFSRYRYTKSGERIDNITDWALNKFVKKYGKKGVTKDAIFHYVYALLHDPIYRVTYALNLRREFPRIPFYPDFERWVAWGEALMALHIGYEDVAPWPVERIDKPGTRAKGTHPKPILTSKPELGTVVIDADTQIAGIPPEAWSYRLGNRSAIDWVLDQHKEKKPRDPTIAAKFNTYRFADYKESMIALLAKVVRVSMETVTITEAMKAIDRPLADDG
ncbi:type ISP restriction/modification enzyme [uncultured Sphingomonas sp.]|uniref:type ISP restriction/modification enzyme n=1 Tax=uncultured Sphingomonas sp. TaxID=158754 RepID=UPI0025FA0671|nr:type ISP restriction/modification enzyme [uncultured Sphingomonas sp.]